MNLTTDLLKKIADQNGDAFYLADSDQFRRNYHALLGAFRAVYPHAELAYSYKTNYLPLFCRIVCELGGWAEVVSGMECEIARRVGVPPERVILNGPYKDLDAMEALLVQGGTVNLDSACELDMLEEIALRNKDQTLHVGLRCNFDIGDGRLSRFGFDVNDGDFSRTLCALRVISNVRLRSLHCHFATRSLDTWTPRAEGMLRLLDEHFPEAPEMIDLGGGLFGGMGESLQRQFDTPIPSFEEYAREAATPFARRFRGAKKPPTLLIEPGSALVGDAMRFAAKVESIKIVRGKPIATLKGSVYNINPTLNGKNPPVQVYAGSGERRVWKGLDFGGYTCIESDYLYRGYDGPLAAGDTVVFENVGSYSLVLKPPFILPNFPVVELCDDGRFATVKRAERFDDLFTTFSGLERSHHERNE